MNATAIEWADFTWNWFVGCLTGCKWCYARKQAKRMKHKCRQCYEFFPHIHPERLEQPSRVKIPKAIFAGSMGDPAYLSEEQWGQLCAVMEANHQHTFMVLTKTPHKLTDRPCPDNLWVGVSVTCQAEVWRIRELQNMRYCHHLFVSFEPLRGEISADINLSQISGIIIGPETGNQKSKVEPKSWWIDILQLCAKRQGVLVFMKDKLKPYYNDLQRELPWYVHKRRQS